MAKEEIVREAYGEYWKDIKGYEELYQISNLGNIKGLKRNIIKKQCLNKDYRQINLCKNGIIKTYAIHKLLAITFLNHKPKGHEIVVDHIDVNKENNNILNLQLITQIENTSKSKSNKFTGATYCKKSGKWTSRIRIQSKYNYLGLFKTKEEAHKRYLLELNQPMQKPEPPKFYIMTHLISNTAFGDYLNTKNIPDYEYRHLRSKFDEFLKQPLELWKFVPCKLVDGVWLVLEEPKLKYELMSYVVTEDYKEYQEAKEACVFEGWKLESQSTFTVWIENNSNVIVFTDRGKININGVDIRTTEELIKYKPKLTPNALKQIGL